MHLSMGPYEVLTKKDGDVKLSEMRDTSSLLVGTDLILLEVMKAPICYAVPFDRFIRKRYWTLMKNLFSMTYCRRATSLEGNG